MMGRKRVIDTDEFFFDEDIYEIAQERGMWLYVRLWALAEDWGGYVPKYGNIALKTGVLRMTSQEVQEIIEQLIKLGKIIPYEVSGVQYHWIKNLLKHQPLNNPSPPVLPLPPWITCEIKEYASKKKYASYRVNTDKLAEYTGSLLVTPPKTSEPTGNIRECLETKRNETETKLEETRKALSSGDDPAPSSFSVNDLANIWNQAAPAYLPRVARIPLSPNRSKKLNRHTNGSGPEYWEALFRDIDHSPFYSGKDGKWPGMDFDWAVINHEKLRRKLDAEKNKRPIVEDDGPHYKLYVPPPPNPDDLTPDPDCTTCHGRGIHKPPSEKKHRPCDCLHPVGASK